MERAGCLRKIFPIAVSSKLINLFTRYSDFIIGLTSEWVFFVSKIRQFILDFEVAELSRGPGVSNETSSRH